MKWGLIPHWSKFEDKTLSTTNARSENLVEGAAGMWRSLKGRRCAVMCQGYYEWQTKGKDKLPHLTKHKSHKVMLLAGLWDVVTLEGETEPTYTFTIVTTDACESFRWLHDRQPVILHNQSDLNDWLNTSIRWSKRLEKIAEPYSGPELECYRVPNEVGRVGTESPAYLKPINERKDGIEMMFGKQRQKAQSDNGNASSRDEATASPKKEPSAVKEEADSEIIEISPEERKSASLSSSKLSSSSADLETKSSSSTPVKKRPATNKSTPSPQKKRKLAEAAADSAKITSFFSKKT